MILHEYAKHKFIANIDKTTLNINHFAHFNSDKEIKNLLAKTDEMRGLKFARFLALPKQCKARAVVADRFCKQPNTSAHD